MKIGIITNLYEPHTRGGAEKIAQLSAEALSQGNEVFVITTQPQKESWEVKNNVKVYRFRPLNIFYYLNDYKHNVVIRLLWHFLDIFNFQSALKVKNILKKEKPDVVIMHNLKGLGYLIPGKVKKMQIKSFLVLHDVQYAVPSGLILHGQEKSFTVNGFLTKIYQFICKKLIIADNVISPSKWLLDFYKNKGFFKKANLNVLPNPVVLNDQENKVEKNNNQVLGFLGQIEKHKGIEDLLQVAKQNDYNLVVAGEGSLLEGLRKKYNNCSNIKFLGRLKKQDLDKFFAQISFLVVPTLCYENSPTVIYESYSFGCPVIAADIGGVGELVGTKTGYLFKPGSLDEMVGQINQALDSENYLDMSKNCLEKVKKYDLNCYLEDLLAILKNQK